MYVYKIVDKFDHYTGMPAGTQKVYSHTICDFTGQTIDNYENPNEYIVDHCDNDPCFGDGEGERWLSDYEKELYGEEEYDNMDGCHHELFGQSRYMFKHMSEKFEGYEVFGEMVKVAMEELDEIYSLDHLLRWSRGRMLEKVIKAGQYKLEQFLEE